MASVFGKNFRSLRKVAGYTQSEIADMLGVSTVTINNWETGKIDMPRQKEIKDAIKDIFNATDDDLFSSESGYYVRMNGLPGRPPNAMPLIASKPAYLPLHGRVHAGDATEPDILDSMVPVPFEVAEKHPDAYLLLVEGDCMSRVYPEGSLIAIDPNIAPSNGSIAVVSIDDTDYIMRRVYKGASTLVLSPDSYSDEWEDIVITADDEHTVEYHGVVVWYQAPREMV